MASYIVLVINTTVYKPRIHFWDSLALLAVHSIIANLRIRGIMSEKSPSKDEALEALDFIVNVLKEHEKDLDRLVGELGTVADQLGETGEFSTKIKQIEDKIGGMQYDVENLVKSISAAPREISPREATVSETSPKVEAAPSSIPKGLPILLHCKQWEDFLSVASQAQMVSFSSKEADKTFKVVAVKNNQVYSFSGEMPKFSALLKAYLSKQLQVSEKQILEGEMSLG